MIPRSSFSQPTIYDRCDSLIYLLSFKLTVSVWEHSLYHGYVNNSKIIVSTFPLKLFALLLMSLNRFAKVQVRWVYLRQPALCVLCLALWQGGWLWRWEWRSLLWAKWPTPSGPQCPFFHYSHLLWPIRVPLWRWRVHPPCLPLWLLGGLCGREWWARLW